jgi:ribosomal protein L37AE/L43A
MKKGKRKQAEAGLGLLRFQEQFGTEQACIQHLARLRWPDGFRCPSCKRSRGYQHRRRPRIWECADCGHQESVTAGTVMHKTRTPLRVWFMAAYLMGRDKRGVSAMFLARELGLRYETAWLLAHKLRHGLTERQEWPLKDYVEIDETFIGGRDDPDSKGRSLKNPNKSMVVVAVEKRWFKAKKGIRQQGFIAGGARVRVVPDGGGKQLVDFVKGAVEKGAWVLTDGWEGYRDLKDDFTHFASVQGAGKNAAEDLPIIHTLFSNMKAWLVGTHHGVSAKHLPRYLREWNYRFNRRWGAGRLEDFLIRRAATRGTITYAELVGGLAADGSPAMRTTSEPQLLLPLPPPVPTRAVGSSKSRPKPVRRRKAAKSPADAATRSGRRLAHSSSSSPKAT